MSTRSFGRRINGFIFGFVAGAVGDGVLQIAGLEPSANLVSAFQSGACASVAVGLYQEALFESRKRGLDRSNFDPLMWFGALASGILGHVVSTVLFGGNLSFDALFASVALKWLLMLPSYSHFIGVVFGLFRSRKKMWPIHLIALSASSLVAGSVSTALAGPFSMSIAATAAVTNGLYFLVVFTCIELLEKFFEK